MNATDSTYRDPLLESINSQRTSGAIKQALYSICDCFPEHEHDAVFIELACKTIVSAATSSAAHNSLCEDPRIKQLIGSIALQSACRTRPSLLAHAVAANAKQLPTHRSLASLLRPILDDLLSAQAFNVNAAVVFLTIRQHFDRWRQRAASALHKTWLPHCDWTDLTVLYNTMFTRSTCHRNVRDLQAFTRDTDYLVRDLRPHHWLMMCWVLHYDIPAMPAVRLALSQLVDGPTRRLDYPIRAIDFRELCSATAPRDYVKDDVDSTWVALSADLLSSLPARPSPTPRGPTRAWLAPRPDTRWRRGIGFAWSAIRRPVSALARRTKPRVALCVSGQLRGYQQAWASWQRFLMPGAEVTVFIHSWRQIGYPTPSPLRAHLPFEGEAFCKAWKRIGTQEGLDEMRRRYPSVFGALSSSKSITQPALRDYYNARDAMLDDETQPPFAGMSNQQKMHYKIEGCHQLLGEDAGSFDLVVRIRPDLAVRRVAFDWRELTSRCRDSTTIFADQGYGQQYGHLFIGDQFAAGSPQVMGLYSRAWTLAPRLFEAGLLSVSTPFVGHATLAECCWLAGLSVHRVPIQFGPLCEASPLSRSDLRSALENDASQRNDRIDIELLDALESR